MRRRLDSRRLARLALVLAAAMSVAPASVAAQERESPRSHRIDSPSTGVSIPEPPRAAAPPAPSPGKPAGSPGRGGHRGPSGRYHRPHHGYPYYYGFGFYWPYGRWYSPYYSALYYPWGLAWYPAYPADDRIGGLALKIRPKKTKVYVDGEYAGKGGEFDGWPSYLWLEIGRHELIFFREGYETEVRVVDVRSGPVRGYRVELEKGTARPAEELTESRTGSPADGRVAAAGAGRVSPKAELDLRREPGRFRLEVQPSDASIYLDGRFLGTGEQLGSLRGGMMVDSGEHLLEVVRPGFATERVEFQITDGEEKRVQVELERGNREP